MFNCGLVLEGGGTRGIYTSGVLDAFIENGIEFPYVIGVSAGSCNGVSYLGKCLHRQHDIMIDYVNDKRYMSIESMIKNGEYLNCNWIFNDLSYDILPLDQDQFEASGAVFCCVVTNAKTGKAEYLYPKSFRERGCIELRASCSLPLATKGVMLGGELYYDGGLIDSIPLKRAIDDGCQKAVVILTQHKGYRKQPKGVKASKLFRQYPKISEAVADRHNKYNEQLDYVNEMHNSGVAYVIQPHTPLDCSTLEKNTVKLESIYQLGYKQGLKQIEDVKAFLNN